MKTKTIRKAIQFSILLLFVAFTQSCETEIPPEDTSNPNFSLRIYGDGFDHTFNQDTDFDNIKLNLKRNTSYDFTFTGTDSGGVDTIQWSIAPSGYLRIDTRIPAPWNYSYRSGTEYIEWEGDRSDPLTGAALTGTFTAPYVRTRVVFTFNVTDFGGETGSPNTTTKELNISTGNVAHIGIINL